MPRASRTAANPEFWIDFTLRNACVTFYDDAFSRFRSAFLARGTPVDAMVHGFTEYTLGYQRLTQVRTPRPGDRLDQCVRGPPVAIGMPATAADATGAPAS